MLDFHHALIRTQRAFIAAPCDNAAFGSFLSDLLSISESQAGVIAAIESSPQGGSCLRACALSGLDWLAALALCERTLAANTTVHDVLPMHDLTEGAREPSHFIGIPLLQAGKGVAVLVLIDRRDGYDETFVASLSLAVSILTELVVAQREALAKLRAEQGIHEREHRYQELALLSRSVMWDVNTNGLYTYVSPTATEVWGFKPDELVGRKHFYELHPSEGRADFTAAALAMLSRHEPLTGLLNAIRTGAGATIWVETHGSARFDAEGACIGYRGVDIDVSARLRTERMKEEFVAIISHELRTPLTSIVGALGLLANGLLGELTEKGKLVTEIAMKNSKQLTLLINDLLDMEKMFAGKLVLDWQHQPLLPLLNQALETNQNLADQQDITLELIEPPLDMLIDVDGHRLMQVLCNYLSNAIKFSPRNSKVTLSAVASEAGWIRIAVSDQGPGIPDSFHDLVFEKFTQLDSSTSRAVNGSGLGLAICKGLAELMGGKVGFSSLPGEGCTFYIDLPRKVDRS